MTNGCQTSLNENKLNNLFHDDVYGPETRPAVSNYIHSNINNPVLANSDTRGVNNVDLCISIHTPINHLRQERHNPCDTGVNPMANPSMLGQFWTMAHLMGDANRKLFNGDPLEYYKFINNFEQTLMKCVKEPATVIHALVNSCEGEARDAIEMYLMSQNPTGGLQFGLST